MDKKTCLFSNDTPVVLIYWLLKNTMNVVINGGNESFEKKKKSYKYQYDFFTGIDQSIVCIIQ